MAGREAAIPSPPIASDCSSCIIGRQVEPPLVVFQTPPPVEPAYSTSPLVGWIANTPMRPVTFTGPRLTQREAGLTSRPPRAAPSRSARWLWAVIRPPRADPAWRPRPLAALRDGLDRAANRRRRRARGGRCLRTRIRPARYT